MLTLLIDVPRGECRCGCGKAIKPPAKYVQGHHTRLMGLIVKCHHVGARLKVNGKYITAAEYAFMQSWPPTIFHRGEELPEPIITDVNYANTVRAIADAHSEMMVTFYNPTESPEETFDTLDEIIRKGI